MPKKNLTVRLEDDERAWLEAEAKKQSRSAGNLIRYILHCYRTNRKPSEPIEAEAQYK